MLSFFSKKKPSPPGTPPEEVIPGPEPPTQNNNGDDFIFIERRPGNPQAPEASAMYPPMPQAPFGLPYPMSPYQRATHPSGVSSAPVPYIQGVPFEFAPQLSAASCLETIQMQVDEILAIMTRQMSVDDSDIYNFSLERSVQNESTVY